MTRTVARPTDTPVRSAAYTRVSTLDQAREGFSLGEQQRRVRALAESKGWELPDAAIYVEEGVSGRRDDRPELARVLARLDEIDVLIVPALSRLGRSNRHLQEVFATLDAKGVELVSIAESIDTGSAAGKLLRNVLAALAEFEADLLGERVAGSSLAARKSGNAPGGRFTTYGYRRGEEPGELVIDPAQAEVVRRIYREYIGGASQRTILRSLDADDVPTATGAPWSQRTLARILANRTYCGDLEYKRGEVVATDAVPAIITRAEWEQVAELRGVRDNSPGSNRGRRPKRPFLFTGGLLRCGDCGHALVPRSRKAGSVYECRGRREHGPDSCRQVPIKAEPVDAAVTAWFIDGALFDAEQSRVDYEARAELALRESAALCDQAESEVARLEAEQRRIAAAVRSGELPSRHGSPMLDEIAEEIEAAGAEVERLQSRRVEVEEDGGSDRRSAFLDALAGVQEAMRARVRDPEAVESVRAALIVPFESFTLHWAPQAFADLVEIPPPPGVDGASAYLTAELRLGTVPAEDLPNYAQGFDGRPVNCLTLPSPTPISVRSTTGHTAIPSRSPPPGRRASPSSCPARPPPTDWPTPSIRSKRSTRRRT